MQELRRQLELGPDPAEVRRAREWVRAQLDGGGGPVPGTPADTVVLLVSELVTNAVVHTGRPAVLRLLLPGEAHTHEEHEEHRGGGGPSEEPEPRAHDRAAAPPHRARPVDGHRAAHRRAQPDRPAPAETARPGSGTPPRCGDPGASAESAGAAPRVAAAPAEPSPPPTAARATAVVSLPGLLRLTLPGEGGQAQAGDSARRAASEESEPSGSRRPAVSRDGGAEAARPAPLRPLGRTEGRETHAAAPHAAWVRVGAEAPGLSAGVCPLTGRPTLRLEVFDTSSRAPRRRAACRDDTSGRGLELVELLADRWGWRREGRGKQIWCELDLPGCDGGHGGRRVPARY